MSVSELFRCIFPSWHYISCDKRSILVHTLSTVLVCKLVSWQNPLSWKKMVLLANTVIFPEHYKVAEFRVPVLGNSGKLGNLCSIQMSDLSFLLFIMFWEFYSCMSCQKWRAWHKNLLLQLCLSFSTHFTGIREW